MQIETQGALYISPSQHQHNNLTRVSSLDTSDTLSHMPCIGFPGIGDCSWELCQSLCSDHMVVKEMRQWLIYVIKIQCFREHGSGGGVDGKPLQVRLEAMFTPFPTWVLNCWTLCCLCTSEAFSPAIPDYNSHQPRSVQPWRLLLCFKILFSLILHFLDCTIKSWFSTLCTWIKLRLLNAFEFIYIS